MKGFTFYEEFGNKAGKRTGKSAGNVCAVFGPVYLRWHSGKPTAFRESVAGIFSRENSAVVTTSASLNWLRETCKRVSEKRARKVHPALFDYLDKSA